MIDFMILLSYKLLIAHSCKFIGRVHNIINDISSNIKLPVYDMAIQTFRMQDISSNFPLSQFKPTLYLFILNQTLKKLFSNTQNNFIMPQTALIPTTIIN